MRLRHLMVCVSGYSGTGKDELVGHIVRNHGAVQTGLADPAKRHMADLYGFTEHQLFGPSSARNAGDLRYPKVPGLHASDFGAHYQPAGTVGELQKGVRYWVHDSRYPVAGFEKLPHIVMDRRVQTFVPEGHPSYWLSPREALQRYCELMNLMFLDTWIRKGIEVHKLLSVAEKVTGDQMRMRYRYSRMYGLTENDPTSLSQVGSGWTKVRDPFITCFADFRHRHEIRLAHQSASDGLTPVLIRIRRPSVPNPPFDHRSETEQASIPDEAFDFVIDNDGTVEELHARTEAAIRAASEPG